MPVVASRNLLYNHERYKDEINRMREIKLHVWEEQRLKLEDEIREKG